MRNGMFRHHKSAARVDLMHQVKTAHVGLYDRRALNGASIIDDDVEAAERCRGFLDRAFHLRLVARIDDERQRVSAGSGALYGGGEDSARKPELRLGGLGRIYEVGAG